MLVSFSAKYNAGPGSYRVRTKGSLMSATTLLTPTTEIATGTGTAHQTLTGTDPMPTGTPTSAPLLRLSLAPAGSKPALLDGAWWPHSRNLTTELPSLTADLDVRWERITRITVNPARWPVIPHKVQVKGHVVKVGWFADEQDEHKLMLLSYDTGRWDLLVVPPETDPETADRLMTAAADPRRTSTASQLMAEAAADSTETAAQTSVWDSEGGHDIPRSVRGTHN